MRQLVEMVRLEQAIRCAACGQVTLFEFDVPMVGAMSSSFDCPKSHSALNPAGGVEVVDLEDYEKSELAKVVL
jgi:hypothetical protein